MKNLGAKVFDSKKTARRYMDIRENLTDDQRVIFADKVNELFDRKVTSDEGEFDCFAVTAEDLTAILESMLD